MAATTGRDGLAGPDAGGRGKGLAAAALIRLDLARAATITTDAAATAPRDPDPPPAEAEGDVPADAEPPLALAHTDWLYHRLCVDGPGEMLQTFRAAARGPGTIAWDLDLDRLEEEWFLRLVAPAIPQRRTLSLDGARVLASQLRDAVARRHAPASGPEARDQACPFDLNALLPVPRSVLRLGPDDPRSLAWLWQHWGTTQALRHVAETTTPVPRSRQAPARADTLSLTFWSADWTPWRAFSTIQARWPALRVEVQPVYQPP